MRCMIFHVLVEVLLLAGVVFGSAQGANKPSKGYPHASTKGCSRACSALARRLPAKVFTAKDSEYRVIKTEFFTTFNADLNPACYVMPSSAEDVSTTVTVAKTYQCQFAVKSGAHTYFEGASSIQNGITIDLQNINQITPTNDGAVLVGPGNRWIDVYSKLDPMNITVTGGRVSDVGVGGLLLSGGISWLHPQQGFGCDNVRNYQLVDARGRILEVNQNSYPDLFWALRGGGNNFGIVTRFDMDAFPQGELWGGTMVHDISHLETLTTAWAAIAYPSETADPKAKTWFSIVYIAALGSWGIYTQPIYTDPVPLSSPPKAFKPFIDTPYNYSAIRIAPLGNLTLDSNQARGLAGAEWDITMKWNTDAIHYMYNLMQKWDGLKSPAIVTVAVSFQALTKSGLSHTSKRGGDALGLTADDGPLLECQLGVSWQANATEAETSKFLKDVNAYRLRAQEWAVQKGKASRYIYMNYASAQEDVFAGYGQANLKRLRQISRKYDPEGVFQTLLPGGKKLIHGGGR